jgi:rRNA maturation RNase YbeY
MAHEIELVLEVDLLENIATELLVQAVQTTLANAGVQAAELTVLLAGDPRLAALNAAYRNLNEPTDVLAFPSGEGPALPENSAYLGDIAISLDRARQQAKAAGHSVMDELQLLVVHGTLHLLGHNHREPEERDDMWKSQRAILTTLGLPPSLGG